MSTACSRITVWRCCLRARRRVTAELSAARLTTSGLGVDAEAQTVHQQAQDASGLRCPLLALGGDRPDSVHRGEYVFGLGVGTDPPSGDGGVEQLADRR